MKIFFNNNNIFKEYKFVLFFITCLLISILIYVVFNKFSLNDFIQDYFILTILILSIPIAYLLYKVISQIYNLFFQAKLKVAGYELHKKLATLFSIVCLIPSIAISAFSIITLNTALDGWFSKKISTAVSQSVEVSNRYLIEHQNAMKGEILEFAKQLNDKAISFSSNQNKITSFLNYYVNKNNLTDAILIDSSRNILANSKFAFEIYYLDLPNKYYNLANNGKIIISNDKESNKLNAFIKLDQFVDAYLLTTRFIDEKVLEAISKSNIAATDYKSIELNLFDIKVSILVIFIIISFLLLLISLYVGLGLSNRLITPIAELIYASEEVGRGNLNFKIKNDNFLKNKITELKKLGDAFNKMIFDIKTSRLELIEANDQLDKRRQFSEAVLSGVYSGVIGLDKDFKINLPNKTAEKLLKINLNKHFNKKFDLIFPEFKILVNEIQFAKNNFIEKKIEIFKDKKKRVLITRMVKQINENEIIGYVITFDDITDLIHAQKLAAWSDVVRRIAHEIKNPLTPIKLGAERLKNNINNPKDLLKYKNTSDMILKHVDDIGHLIDEFSSFARLPKPKLLILNCQKFLEESFIFFRTSYSNIKFEMQDNTSNFNSLFIHADEKQLRQVLGNLIKNSSENFDENKIKNKKIIFNVYNDLQYFYLKITDNGVGIKNFNENNILEPYFTTKKHGTGLGLAITKKILEDHQAEILIKTSKKGTEVEIKFQIYQ